jgi:hypothetical protein
MTTAQQAETAAQNYDRAVINAGYQMTPARAASKAALMDAIAAAYPTLDAVSIFDMWSELGGRIADAAVRVGEDADL